MKQLPIVANNTDRLVNCRLALSVHDFHATLLRLLGIDHEQFTFKYQGLDQKLTGVEPSKIIKGLIA